MSARAAARSRLAAAGIVLAWSLLPAGHAVAVVSSGLLLTNFLSATYALPSGAGVDEYKTGIGIGSVPNSASAWVLAGTAPALCMASWKLVRADGSGAQFANPGPESGDTLCFEIGFSNCGTVSGFAVTVTDALPANVTASQSVPGGVWVCGGGAAPFVGWASSLAGPWNTGSWEGQQAPAYLRWVLDRVGMHKSGFIRYCAVVQ